jgi:hypothetical protein
MELLYLYLFMEGITLFVRLSSYLLVMFVTVDTNEGLISGLRGEVDENCAVSGFFRSG